MVVVVDGGVMLLKLLDGGAGGTAAAAGRVGGKRLLGGEKLRSHSLPVGRQVVVSSSQAEVTAHPVNRDWRRPKEP